MNNTLTSIGKIITIKFLLIFLSIYTFLDMYFTIILKKKFLEEYLEISNFESILILTLAYLIVINILIPMVGLIFSVVFWVMSFIRLKFDNNNVIISIFSSLYNTELRELYRIRDDAIEENNSAKIKMFEIGLEEYKERHSIYLFSFTNLVLFVVCFIYYSDKDSIILLGIYNVLFQTDGSKGSEFLNAFFVYIPLLILLFYSFKYITSFNIHKLSHWFHFS